MDTAGFCRFHRGWAEETVPDIFGSLYGMKDQLLAATAVTASRINSRNASVYWESERDIDFVLTFLKRVRDVEGEKDPQLLEWISRFEKDKKEAALENRRVRSCGGFGAQRRTRRRASRLHRPEARHGGPFRRREEVGSEALP